MSSYSTYGGASGGSHERVTRVLVVGEASVGKTLLIRRLCDKIFGDTSIKSADDASATESLYQSQGTVADDYLGPEWGPTVGIAVEALKRTTTVLEDTAAMPKSAMTTPYDASGVTKYTMQSSISYPLENGNDSTCSLYGTQGSTNGYRGANGVLQYRGQGFVGSNNVSLPYQVGGASRQYRQTVLQTVEFHELGGTHGYRDVALQLLRNIDYDGVMFVYHRRSLTSTLYLKEWYRWVRNVFSGSQDIGIQFDGGANKPGKSPRTMPRFMLVGTQLSGDELPAAAAGIAKATAETLHIASGTISDESLLDGNLEVKLRALQSPHTLKQRRGVWHALSKLFGRLVWPYHVCWCVLHPFFFLSKQYEEEIGQRGRLFTCASRAVMRFVWLLYQAEQALLYIMAVILFGPYQEAVVLGHSSLKRTLEEMLKDELCVSQAHVCRLDSNISLQSSLDDVVAFFDILLRQHAPGEDR